MCVYVYTHINRLPWETETLFVISKTISIQNTIYCQKNKNLKSSEAIKKFQCQNHDKFQIFFNMQGIWSQDTNTKFLLLCLLKTVSSFKSVLGLLINLPSCFTKTQYTLRAPNKSEPFHFTAPWVKSWQPWRTIKRVLFSSLRVREA